MNRMGDEGYALHESDGFRCRYCGLDGTRSVTNWLALSRDHLLPEKHPDRDDPDFSVTACMPCNVALGPYFAAAAARGERFDGVTPDQLVALRTPVALAARRRLKAFWRRHVAADDDR